MKRKIMNFLCKLQHRQLFINIRNHIMNNRKSKEINNIKFEQKLTQLKQILNDLSDNFDVKYSFNYIKLDEDNNIQKRDMLYSSNITSDDISLIIHDQCIVKNRFDSIIRLIHDGILLARCNEPVDGLTQGNTYIIDKIIYGENNKSKVSFIGKEDLMIDRDKLSFVEFFSRN